jgi:CDP-diacylglycerol--glycerol-3-phosphate 3-phosphatidyltransferase
MTENQEKRHLDKTILTPANIVTMIRIVLIPVFVFVLLAPWPLWVPQLSLASLVQPYIAAAVFALLALTDGVDGYLARSRNEVTTFGKFLDPIADKILVTAALLALVELSVLPAWVVIVIVSREFLVSGVRMVAVSEGVVIAASKLGKVKTVAQIIAILLFILKMSPLLSQVAPGFQTFAWYFAWTVMIIALALTIISLVDYMISSAEVMGFKIRKPPATPPVCQPRATAQQSASHLSELASAVVSAAKANNTKLATAESCTGGLVAAAITSVAGSSDVFVGSIVSYANSIKIGELGVDAATLEANGAVSSEVASQMAQGAAAKLGADIAVSITGIAGPGGATDDKPLGTVWFGLSNRGNTTSELAHFDGTRQEVREQAVTHALNLLLRFLRGSLR